MMKNRIWLVILGLGLLLTACKAEGIPPAATPSVEVVSMEAVMATVTSSSVRVEGIPPAATPSVEAVSMEAVTATMMRSIVRVEGVEADGTCVELDNTVTVSGDVFRRSDFEVGIEAYLNAGGSISGLPGALTLTDVDRAMRIQLVSQDVTASGVPDLLIGVTLSYGSGDGETHLLFFTCAGDEYEGEVLFRRAGAGSRMEGLYEGGGVAVEVVRDMNGNGREEVFFSVNWPGYGEHYLLEWKGGQFVSLIEYQDVLGESRNWIETYGEEVGIIDVDVDGVYEIVVGEEGNGAGEGQSVWRWDGERYSRESE